MFGAIIAIGIVVLLIVYLVGKFRAKETKLIVEIESNDEAAREYDVKPGEFVKLVARDGRGEVDVYSNKAPEGRGRLGIIKNYNVYRKIINNEVRVMVHAVNSHSIMLQLVKPDDPMPAQ